MYGTNPAREEAIRIRGARESRLVDARMDAAGFTTPDCGPHCRPETKTTKEWHCSCTFCHGKPC